MARWLKIAGKVFAGLVTILIVIVTCAVIALPHFQHEWAPAGVDVELNAKRPVLKAADVPPNSAFDLLRRASVAQVKSTNPDAAYKELRRLNLEMWSEASFPFLARALSNNSESLDLARAAANAPDPQVPTYLSPTDALAPVSNMMRLNDLFRASAARKEGAGDMVGALAELELSIRFAQIVSRGGPLINMLVDTAIELQSAHAIRLLALQREIPPALGKQTIVALLALEHEGEPLAETFREEYRAVPATVEMFYDASKPAMLGFMEDEGQQRWEHRLRLAMDRLGWTVGSTPKTMSANLARVYKVLVRAAGQPYQARELRRLETELVPPMRPQDWLLRRDPAGYLVARMILPTFVPIFIRYHRRSCDLRATALVLAVRQFQQAEHRPPEALEELIPAYLSEIPTDPFNGEPFRYRVRPDGQWVIYSVGPNQMDDGGELPAKDPKKYDDPGDVVFCECEATLARAKLQQTANR